MAPPAPRYVEILPATEADLPALAALAAKPDVAASPEAAEWVGKALARLQ